MGGLISERTVVARLQKLDPPRGWVPTIVDAHVEVEVLEAALVLGDQLDHGSWVGEISQKPEELVYRDAREIDGVGATLLGNADLLAGEQLRRNDLRQRVAAGEIHDRAGLHQGQDLLVLGLRL